MKPGARVQAAIDILGAFDAKPKPLERMLKDWGRANRYAGSKDRRAIGEYAYSVMRARAELAHKMGSAQPRALMIALLARSSDDDWKTWFDGDGHNPASLTMEEVKALVADETEMPVATKLNIPDWLEHDVTETFGLDAAVAMAAMAGRAPVDLRANALKGERLEAHDALAAQDIDTGGTPLAPFGLRVMEAPKGPRPDIERSDAYKKGLVEIQDEGSQLAAMIAGAKPGEQVIDLCAGAGGKTLAMAAAMGNHGQIFACDTEGPKLKNLKPRLSRAARAMFRSARSVPGHRQIQKMSIRTSSSSMGLLTSFSSMCRVPVRERGVVIPMPGGVSRKKISAPIVPLRSPF